MLDLGIAQHAAVGLLADDLLRQHQDVQPAIMRLSSRRRSTAALAATVMVCSWLNGALLMPAPRLVMMEKPATLMPTWRARITSGTVDMPTAAPPICRAKRTSAGVSKCGPENQT